WRSPTAGSSAPSSCPATSSAARSAPTTATACCSSMCARPTINPRSPDLTPPDTVPAQGDSQVLPLLPLKNTVLFPHLFLPLSVGRPHSIAAVEAVLGSEEKTFIVAAQRDGGNEQPGFADLYNVGTRAVIKKFARGEGVLELIVQGVERVALLGVEQTDPYLKVRFRPMPLPADSGPEVEALQRGIMDLAAKVLELAEVQTPVNLQQMVEHSRDPLRFAFLLGSMLSLDVQKEQALLEARSRVEALRLLHGYLSNEVQVLELRKK